MNDVSGFNNSDNSEIFTCGIDEAGRGPLAGPVSAAAVILPRNFPVNILKDSKKLNAEERGKIKDEIFKRALSWGIGWAQASEIDEINILKASLLAMKRAFEAMPQDYPNREINLQAIVDGLHLPEISVPCKAIVKADSMIPAVMAASILAKTARDRIMEHYAIFYPQYGYDKHKGYPTKAHREAILRWGHSPIQRKSFTVKTD